MTEQTSSARSIRIDVLSIFPALLAAVVNESILKIAQHKGALDFYAHDLRDWTDDFHRSTDDSPYGGGAGMVMKVEPLAHAIEAITAMDARPPHTVFLAPVGRPFTQKVAQDFALQ
ncbi:MAG: tRNA (guanosine(37)-N1)-methyltransferase TrmD, partial [Coriobacteriia bacterium]|nr:tRNA (guanosine(37)-N1)-methyltransferase TrmD [Coriobacteriia bacterium]